MGEEVLGMGEAVLLKGGEAVLGMGEAVLLKGGEAVLDLGEAVLRKGVLFLGGGLSSLSSPNVTFNAFIFSGVKGVLSICSKSIIFTLSSIIIKLSTLLSV